MSIAFLGAMKNWENDELAQALRAMRKATSKRKRIAAIRQICKPYDLFIINIKR